MKQVLNDLYEYLENFADCNADWDNRNALEQARAIFTTICLVGNFDADTNIVDEMLKRLYFAAQLEGIMEQEKFENFMVEHIV